MASSQIHSPQYREEIATAHRNSQDKNGDVTGAVSLFLDITDRRLAEQQREILRLELECSNQEPSDFSYSLAHDLAGQAQSLTAIGELLLRGEEGELNNGQQHLIGMMTRAAEGMERLVRSMLELAQVGHGVIRREQISLRSVVDDVRVRLAAAIRDTDATIHCGELPLIDADRTQMEQLFQNLIANAIQYRRSGNPPVISISSESAETGWKFAVQDNGQGIPADSLERIFEPLKRVHGKDVAGIGLGLALCRRIVERRGGRIWAESPGAGQGTAIHISIPRLATK